MSSTRSELLGAARKAASDEAAKVLATSKTKFLSIFGTFLNKQDLEEIAALFDKAAQAKTNQFLSQTEEQAQEYQDIYDACLDTAETIGDRYLIVGEAKAGVFLRGVLHQIVSGAFAVLGAVLQAALGVVLPGVGSLIGAGANAGIQHVVHYFLGD